ncbi:heavy metal translocating P-type ATPase [Hamiltosporidium tvaerminnensis]|uniref:Heavy metal translocating P-type ATPase n=1 Tax=Hamiltosporidium tvaerminnensis TaxID=1176355 RepID=A0A4Q9L4S0_9MICR|nr:Cu(2+)-transporting P-type ATPase [Hamiltosporidium tvaerminnensis]TBU02527.1 heavy metal translocating P-type ATPase [Hamiltosporidium tvaerminnensis]
MNISSENKDLFQKIYEIQNFSCGDCENKIKNILKSTKGIKNTYFNIFLRQIKIIFDRNDISEKQILKKLKDNGYIVLRNKKFWSTIFYIVTLFYVPQLFSHFFLRKDKKILFIEFILALFIQLIVFTNISLINIRKNISVENLVFLGSFLSFAYAIIFIAIDYTNIKEISSMLETSSMICFFILFGKFFRENIESEVNNFIQKLPVSHYKFYETDLQKFLPIDEIKVGDIIRIENKMTLPIDGIITNGVTHIDESNLTGESFPKKKEPGMIVYCGTTVIGKGILVRVTKKGKNTFLSEILQLIKNSQFDEKYSLIRKNRIVNLFIRSVLGISLICFLIYLILGILNIKPKILYTTNNSYVIFVAMKVALNVLIVACPCSLTVSAPIALSIATQFLCKKGIIIKNIESILKVNSIKKIFFDKTGTLTYGNINVTNYCIFKNISEEIVLNILSKIEKDSLHPIGKALYLFTKETFDRRKSKLYKNIFYNRNETQNYENSTDKSTNNNYSSNYLKKYDFLNQEDIQINKTIYISGNGIKSTIIHGNKKFVVKLGKKDFVSDYSDKEANKFEYKKYLNEEKINLEIFMSFNNEIIAFFILDDQIKSEAIAVIQRLNDLNIQSIILSGDTLENTHKVAKTLGIPTFYSNLTSKSKLELISVFKTPFTSVCMVGDGINDSAALKISDIGISINNTLNITDVYINSDNLLKILDFILFSKKVTKRINANYIINIVYNITILPISVGLLIPFNIYLSSRISCLSMFISSLCIIISSYSLKNHQ